MMVTIKISSELSVGYKNGYYVALYSRVTSGRVVKREYYIDLINFWWKLKNEGHDGEKIMQACDKMLNKIYGHKSG